MTTSTHRSITDIETAIAVIEAEQRSLDIAGSRANSIRFARAADRDRYQELTKRLFRLTDERDLINRTLAREARQARRT